MCCTFGHVVEGVLSKGSLGTFRPSWTKFYELLGQVARENDRPFSAKALCRRTDAKGFFHAVMKRFDNYATASGTQQMPDVFDLQEAIDRACELLRSDYNGDARKIGKRLFFYSYRTAIRRAAVFLEAEALRLQFGKLGLFWKIWGSRLRAPGFFQPPFSTHILALLLGEGFLQTDASTLDAAEMETRAASFRAQVALLVQGAEIVQRSTTPAVAAWKEEEERIATDSGLDWVWFFQYRFDQQLYHMAKIGGGSQWLIESDGHTIKRPK